MNKDIREALIDSDLGFLNDITVHEIDGKLMMGNDSLPFNVACVLTEKEFVKNWIMPFALGNDLGINYFNGPVWHSMTNKGTQAVMVVDDDDHNVPVLLVQPMITHSLTPGDFELLRLTSQHIQQVQADVQRSQDPNATMGAAKMLRDRIEAKRITITDLVSPEFYAKHGIIPAVEQKIYYIKDIIRKGKAPIEDITKSRDMLYRDHRGEHVTDEEYQFLYTLSQGNFIIEGKVGKAAVASAAEKEEPSNPLEC